MFSLVCERLQNHVRVYLLSLHKSGNMYVHVQHIVTEKKKIKIPKKNCM